MHMSASEMTFTASMQMAIDWVVKNLTHPRLASGWERPCWDNFVWFTRIVGEDITEVSDPAKLEGHWFQAEDHVVERDVVFYHGNDAVARITMRGISTPHTPKAWAVARVQYCVSDHTDSWVSRTLMTSHFSGRSVVFAPVG